MKYYYLLKFYLCSIYSFINVLFIGLRLTTVRDVITKKDIILSTTMVIRSTMITISSTDTLSALWLM